MATKKSASEIKFLDGKDSKEEIYVMWYLQELKDSGIIVDFWYHPEVYTLTNPVMRLEKEFKGRGKKKIEIDVVKSFKAGHTFKPEFRIKWANTEDARGFLTLYTFISESNVVVVKKGFFYTNFSMMSDVDVKPSFQKHDAAAAKFSIIQSIVLNKYKIFVQPVIYQKLFEATFTPERFLKCDISNSNRKINYPVKSLSEFLNT